MNDQVPQPARPAMLHVVADHQRLAARDTVDCTSCDMFDAVLHRFGPTATVLWMHLARLAEHGPAQVSVDELCLFVGADPQPVWKALDRLDQFTAASFASTDVFVVPLWTMPRALSRTRQMRDRGRRRHHVPA